MSILFVHVKHEETAIDGYEQMTITQSPEYVKICKKLQTSILDTSIDVSKHPIFSGATDFS